MRAVRWTSFSAVALLALAPGLAACGNGNGGVNGAVLAVEAVRKRFGAATGRV
jgi:hypothetical protein